MDAGLRDDESGAFTLSALNPGMPARLQGEGKLFDLYFTLCEDIQPGCTTLTASRVEFFDPHGARIPAAMLGAPNLCVGELLLMGDLDGDGAVTAGDAVLSILIATRQITPTDYQYEVGDMNGDGRLDSADAVLIHRLAANWRISPTDDEETLASLLDIHVPVCVALPNVEARPGEKVTLGLDVEPVAGLAGADFVIAQDQRLLLGDVPTTFPGLPGRFTHSVNQQLRGLRIALSAPDALTDAPDAPLVALTFTVSPDAALEAILPVTLANASLKGQYGEDFSWYTDVQMVSGTVKVIGSAQDEGEPEGEGENEGENEGEREDVPEDDDKGCSCRCCRKNNSSVVSDWLLIGVVLLMLVKIQR